MPVSTGGAGYAAPPGGGGSPTAATSPPLGFGSAPSNTLDEPILETVTRDLKRIYKNLVMVVFPFKDRSQQSAALRNWDLWGPMVRSRAAAAARRRRAAGEDPRLPAVPHAMQRALPQQAPPREGEARSCESGRRRGGGSADARALPPSCTDRRRCLRWGWR